MVARVFKSLRRVLSHSLLIERAVVTSRASQTRHFTSTTLRPPVNHDHSALMKHIIQRITISGAISVAAYMQEVLTNPLAGYYMKKDVFGQAGDFITSPEITQVFGELIGVWFVHQWMQTGERDIQIVELGPGRGTLMADILRVVKKFKALQECLSVHLVEVSPALSDIQKTTLTGISEMTNKEPSKENKPYYKQCCSKDGIPVFWYSSIKDIPKAYSFFLAHEFFDALPIHQFQRTDRGWREVLVDVDKERTHSLRFVLAPGPTLASQTYVPKGTSSRQLEVCPQGGVIMEEIGERIRHDGGSALIIDYGEDGNNRHTLRSFSKHKLHDVLEAPGTADITANVDFRFLRQAAGSDVNTYGPVTQVSFLKNMGIDQRMRILLSKASPDQAKQLYSGYKMLTEEMGEKFKVFAVTDRQSPEPAAVAQ
ncbi:predicted protein [Nematostella vectensis]|uniref:Protein arginine methyltransferase NDUFAF7 n=1 Tax=Nematostella vectensis TaxID=45351 RepID=A7SHR9_NEMVE|nr:predicted protein [Nematostella vectensis]|eukprot:XP_001628848.1 predicted protein [Nematostella vectensis]